MRDLIILSSKAATKGNESCINQLFAILTTAEPNGYEHRLPPSVRVSPRPKPCGHQQAFICGLIRLRNDQGVGADGSPLLTNLTPTQQRLVSNGVATPFFWAGIGLMGAPW